MYVWMHDNFEDNFVIKRDFTKYLKESCSFSCDTHFPFKYFLEDNFFRKILANLYVFLAAADVYRLIHLSTNLMVTEEINLLIPLNQSHSETSDSESIIHSVYCKHFPQDDFEGNISSKQSGFLASIRQKSDEILLYTIISTNFLKRNP